jgi:hypothetical protein
MHVANAVMPGPEQAQAFFGGSENGPMVMVNLLSFKAIADYPDGRDPGLSGREAYMRYGAAVIECLAMVGGKALLSGDVTGLILRDVEELWDMVALAYYPGPAAMMQMVALPQYRGIEIDRLAGLAEQLNIRTSASGFSAL